MSAVMTEVKPATKKVAYWPDGYWDLDLEAAKDADTFKVFGNVQHCIVEVDADAEGEAIEEIVQELIATPSEMKPEQ